MNGRKGFRVLTSDHFREFRFYSLSNFDFHFWWRESENRQFSSPFVIIMVCEHEQPEELGNSINLFYNQLKSTESDTEFEFIGNPWRFYYIQTFQSHDDKFFEAAINLFLAACYNIEPICLWY